MEPQERITQFENMAQADPDNDMAHFSLGNAYFQAERWPEAAASFRRCTEINPAMSKAYQLGGEAMINSGDKDSAVEFLTKGYRIAAERGDRMPMDKIGELLESLDAPVPVIETAKTTAAENTGEFRCQCTGRLGTKMKDPPFRGPLGEYIRDHISEETWQAWIQQGTKVINELHLDFSRETDQRIYDQHMIEYLGLEEAVESLRAAETN